ncbi:MAG TPA: glycosyltransferase family 4 protein [Isosphaeraceae bacterium]|nr:glycosyltransferase family 4 protein [Isosphaeraceae bacterium]
MQPNPQADSPLSIGYLSPGWPLDGFPNGVVSYIADMVAPLRRMGHQVTVVAAQITSPEPDPSIYEVDWGYSSRGLVRRLTDWLGYRLWPGRMEGSVLRRLLLTAIERAIAERGVQLFEIEESFGHALWIQRRVPIPVCVRLHGPWFLNGPIQGIRQDRAFRHRVAAEGRAIAKTDGLTASSHDVLEQTRAYYGLALEDAEVFYPPTAPVPPGERWRLEACDPARVLFVGRFDRHKGGDLIIEAFGRVLQEVPQAQLWFVGPDSGYPDAQGRRWGLEEFLHDRLPGAVESGRVVLLGQQPFSALAALRRQAMVSVVCSRYENAPRALIEVLSLGCPTVAARVGGIPEILQDQVDGLLHRPGDPDDLAAQILTLLKDPARAAELGRHAAAVCERRFHPKAIATRAVAFYRRVIARRQASRREAAP